MVNWGEKIFSELPEGLLYRVDDYPPKIPGELSTMVTKPTTPFETNLDYLAQIIGFESKQSEPNGPVIRLPIVDELEVELKLKQKALESSEGSIRTKLMFEVFDLESDVEKYSPRYDEIVISNNLVGVIEKQIINGDEFYLTKGALAILTEEHPAFLVSRSHDALYVNALKKHIIRFPDAEDSTLEGVDTLIEEMVEVAQAGGTKDIGGYANYYGGKYLEEEDLKTNGHFYLAEQHFNNVRELYLKSGELNSIFGEGRFEIYEINVYTKRCDEALMHRSVIRRVYDTHTKKSAALQNDEMDMDNPNKPPYISLVDLLGVLEKQES